MPEEFVADIFKAEQGDVIGPFQVVSDDGLKQYKIILVEELVPAKLDNTNMDEFLRNTMFEEWLDRFTKDGVKISE